MTDEQWGNYDGPNIDTLNVLASRDCQRLTPEPSDGSQAHYEQDDDMLEPRAMSQFIILPNGKILLLNGGQKGTGGFAMTLEPNKPFGHSFATDPVLMPVIYDPNAPKGSRWSNQGLSPSKIPRLYHSSALLLPDGSVIVAGSNPNPDVNLTALYPTEYRADIFFPPYFSAIIRPSPQNLPSTLSYGGPYFNITIPSSSYSGNINDNADATTITIVRGGFTTHAMNMGQRYMQLNNTYTVNSDGTIMLHVAQLPPNPNLFQPGPALLFVNIKGIPSMGKYVIIGNGNIGPQPTSSASPLPPCVRYDSISSSSSHSIGKPKPTFIAGVVVAIVCLALIAGIIIRRKCTEHILEKSMKGFTPLENSKDLEDGLGHPNFIPTDLPLRNDRAHVLARRSTFSGYDLYDEYSGVPQRPFDSELDIQSGSGSNELARSNSPATGQQALEDFDRNVLLLHHNRQST